MKIGIIDGIGPGSTVDYYQSIIKAYRGKTANHFIMHKAGAQVIKSILVSPILAS